MSDKPQGWYLYAYQAFTVTNPEQLKRCCRKCRSTNLSWIRNKETKEEAYVCQDCEYGEIVTTKGSICAYDLSTPLDP